MGITKKLTYRHPENDVMTAQNSMPPVTTDEAQERVSVRSGALLGSPACGSSWIGFWKLPDRYEAWMGVATSASNTADGYAMANKRNGLPVECETVRKLNKLFSWAYRRAKKYRPDWVKIYRHD